MPEPEPQPEPGPESKLSQSYIAATTRTPLHRIATAGIKKPPTIVQPALRSGGTSGRTALALHSESRGPNSRHVSRAKTKPSQAKPKPKLKSRAKPGPKSQAKQPSQPARAVWRGAVWETCQPSQHQAKLEPCGVVRKGRYVCQTKTTPSQQPTIFESKPHSGGA